MHKKITTLVISILLACPLFGQDLLNKKIQLDHSVTTIGKALSSIENKGGFSFMYTNAIDTKKAINIKDGERTVKEWLDLIFDNQIEYVASQNKIILRLVKRIKTAAIEKMIIHGYIYDSLTREVLDGASIVVEEISMGVSSNVYGFFSITVPIGTYHVRVSHVGYAIRSTRITPEKSDVQILLQPSSLQLESVDVRAATLENISSSESGSIRLSAQTIGKIPALAGEVDVFRALQLIPGVKSASEASSGLSVRGGNLDQNMILLDEAPVYNPSHAIGIFSIFNSDAIKDLQLYKGFIPASYGGRLSSVLDVRMKDGNNNQTKVTGGVGTVSSRLTIEGPYSKKRGTFLMSSRYTYSDAFTQTLKVMRENKFRFYFYDLNGKANLNLNKKNKAFLSLYAGQDVNRLGILSDIKWTNTTGTLRWNHVFNEKLFSNTTLLYSNYDYEIRAGFINPFSWRSGIRDMTFKSDFNFFPNPGNQISFGFSSTLHRFNPGRSSAGQISLESLQGLEHALYLSNEQTVGQFTFQYGLRYSLFQNTGRATVFQYDAAHNVKDSTIHTGGVYHVAGGIEPRLATRYALNETTSLKASYSRTFQYLQLLSNSSFGLSPFDIWFPSGPNIKPQKADQVSVGFFKNMKNNSIEFSAELYHRWLYNQSDYANHAQLLFNRHMEGELRFGQGQAYGAELMIRKTTGRLTGWLGYNYSRAKKRIPEISQKTFNANYDQPHNVSVVANYNISPRLEASVNWIYSTGRPTTLPLETYRYQDYEVPVYGERNSVRLPDYHRLDASLTLHSKHRPNKRFSHDWVFSIYNVYARKNPTLIFLSPPFGDFKSETGTDAYRISILPFFPSVTYNFQF